MKKRNIFDNGFLSLQWNKACKAYIKALLDMWELDTCYGYWIANEIGGVYDYGGAFTIGIHDIIYCVQKNVTQEQYLEWQEYICDAAEFGFTTPNLKSWMMGCPRISNEAFARLRAMKKDLNNAIEEAKTKNGENSF